MKDSATIKLLIVDDCAEDRETYRRILGQSPDYDFNILESETGEDGLDACRKETPDCLILDYMLPDIDGLEFLAEIKKIPFQGVVIMLTGEGNETIAVQALKEGAHDYLVKGNDLLTSFNRTLKSALRMNDLNLKRKRAEEKLKFYAQELERSNKELEDFASMACNDLQEPLRKFISFSGRLGQEYDHVLDDQGKNYLERMDRAAKRMKGFIDDLLDYSKVTSRAKPFERTDMKKLIDEVLEGLEIPIARTKATVNNNGLPILEVDWVQMRQLFHNLLANALKFHKEGVAPVINLSGTADGNGNWKILVEDNGIGFDEKHVDRIFKPFERLHGMNSYEGTGMGLAICRKIVDRHGGDITVCSQQGQGTTFAVTLPEKQRVNHKQEVSPLII